MTKGLSSLILWVICSSMLVYGCQKKPKASFTYVVVPNSQVLCSTCKSIEITNTSLGAYEFQFEWSPCINTSKGAFGDCTSRYNNSEHISIWVFQPGVYTVTLTAYSKKINDTFKQKSDTYSTIIEIK